MEIYRWEVVCCNKTSDDGVMFPEPTSEVKVFIFGQDEESALDKARKLIKRDHYQTIECVEEVEAPRTIPAVLEETGAGK